MEEIVTENKTIPFELTLEQEAQILTAKMKEAEELNIKMGVEEINNILKSRSLQLIPTVIFEGTRMQADVQIIPLPKK